MHRLSKHGRSKARGEFRRVLIEYDMIGPGRSPPYQSLHAPSAARHISGKAPVRFLRAPVCCCGGNDLAAGA